MPDPNDQTDAVSRSAPMPAATPVQRTLANGVHLFTAAGVVFAFLAAAEVCSPIPEPKLVFLYLAIQLFIDAVDGPLARAFHVKIRAAKIDGRKIDDIVDYLTYSFVPLLLVWRMGWLPDPAAAWIVPALVASLFGFCNVAAKDEDAGFFLGFPSYWNIVAFYIGLWHPLSGPWPGAILIAVLTVATILPVRFVYPNLAPRPWKLPVMFGAVLWTVLIAAMLWNYHQVPPWVMFISLSYPAAYLGLSLYLDYHARSRKSVKVL